MPPLLSKEDSNTMDSGNESDHDVISTEMLGKIWDRSHFNSNLNQREACYKICDRIRQA